MRLINSAYLAGASALLLAMAAAPASAVTTKDASEKAEVHIPASALAFSQKPNGVTVQVDYVYLPHDGYVAIHGANAQGQPTDGVLGYAPLAKGDHRNVEIKIEGEPKSGTMLWASLYRNVDGDKKLDKSKDTAYWPDDQPAESRFRIL